MTFGNRYNRHEIIIFVLDAVLNENICDLWFFSLSRFVAFWPWNLYTEITLKAKRNHKAADKLCREMVVIRDIWGHSSLKLSSYCGSSQTTLRCEIVHFQTLKPLSVWDTNKKITTRKSIE